MRANRNRGAFPDADATSMGLRSLGSLYLRNSLSWLLI